MRVAGLIACAVAPLSYGCSDFFLNSTDAATAVSARTMDFYVDLTTVVEIIPRDSLIQEPPVNHCPTCPDYAWRTKYGFVGLNSFGVNFAADGLNEKGLSAACLFLPDTQYETPNVTDATRRPIISSLVTYILGNFATVDEVKAGLPRIQIVEANPKAQGIASTASDSPQEPSFPLHFPIHDAAGKSIVVELLGGKVNIYDNPAGVLTNEPPFLDQLALVAAHDKTTGAADFSFRGGYSPIERFQRLTFLNRHGASQFLPNTSYSVATPDQAAVSAAVHIINTVTIPSAYMSLGEATQYTLVRDHAARVLYFRSNENQVLRSIDLTKIDFGDATNRRALSVTFGEWHVDVTSAALASNVHSMDLPPRSVVEGLLRGEPSVFASSTPTGQTLLSPFWAGLALGVCGVAIVGGLAIRLHRPNSLERHPLQ